MALHTRSSLLVTYETWQALFFRDAVMRLSKGRASLGELLAPIKQILFMAFMFSVVRMRSVGGIDTIIWLMVGVLSYNTFRKTMNSAKQAIKSNKVLFSYRQIRPVDTVLVKAAMEFFLNIIVAIILFCGAGLYGLDALPVEPLAAVAAVFVLWLIGLAAALTFSVTEFLLPDSVKFVSVIATPLYMCSGVIFPISNIPPPYRDWLIFNPLLHAVESARLSFAPYYHAIPELDLLYVYKFALVFLCLGLALQVRFRNQLMIAT
jgi:capsular polysaccharide transport system permease protein